MRVMPRCALLLALLAALSVACTAPPYLSRSPRMARDHVVYVPPVVAITDFEDRTNFSGQWNLGGGMAEILVERLLADGSVEVLERRHLDGVLGEIVRQGRDLFRREGPQSRVMNARYLIRGVVTDFTVTGDASGWFGGDSVTSRLRGSSARVSLYVTVSDLETDQIISAVRSEGASSGGGVRGQITYTDFAFGGDAFFRTPLGRATQQAIDRAARQILAEIPREPWDPRVAESGVDRVIINGGENVGLRPGDRFYVRVTGRRVTDPVTGDAIETVPGRVVGIVEVRTVHPLSSHAILLEGEARRGYLLERAR